MKTIRVCLQTSVLLIPLIVGLSFVNASTTDPKAGEVVKSALACTTGDCRRKKNFSLCPGCEWNFAYCLEQGGACVSCTGYCIPWLTEPGQKENAMLLAGINPDDVKDAVPPAYAYYSSEPMPESYLVKGGSKEKMIAFKSAVWNPTEMLRQLDPFGVTISNETLKQLAAADPHAAWVVGQRMKRGDGLMPGIDIHQGQVERTTKIVAITGIDAANGDSTLMDNETIALPEGETLYLRYHTNFGQHDQPTITVVTFISKPGTAALIDFTKTVVRLSAKPMGEMLVVASDGYMAPLYTVEDFEVTH